MLLASGLAAPACAQSDAFSPAAFSGFIDLRAAAADGETGWLDGGFGKARFGGDADGDLKTDAQIVDAVLQWHPHFSFGLSGVVDLDYQSDQDDPLGVTEAFIQYKPLTSGANRYSVRAGLFYPPVSLEHDGPAWTTTRTITPSAINSWISEETKGVGVEGSLRHRFGDQEAGLTLGAFQYNDTAGALLAFRGWALDDVRATASNHYPLPPLNSFITYVQPRMDTPALELDNRVGFYARADWRPSGTLALNAVHYDNEGDMIAVNKDLEWSWRTQFDNVGIAWKPADNTEILAQGARGQTKMGYQSPSGVWVYVEYQAAYLLVSQTFGQSMLTGRLDRFSVDDEANAFYGDNDEKGWAATVAWKRTLSPNAQVMLEALHVDSDRDGRSLASEASHQTQNVFQASTRLSF